MAGELITTDYQLELRGLLMGAGTIFDNGAGGWGGLGVPSPKTADVELEQGDGVYPGRDYTPARMLTFPLAWGGTDPATAMDRFRTLCDAWETERTDELELHMQLPGWGHFYVIGRPRGLAEDLSRLKSGEGAAMASFLATSPAFRTPEDDRLILALAPSTDPKVGFLFEDDGAELIPHITGDLTAQWAPSETLPLSPTDPALVYADTVIDSHDQGDAGVLWVVIPSDLGTIDLFVWGAPDAMPGDAGSSRVWAFPTSAATGAREWVADGWMAAP